MVLPPATQEIESTCKKAYNTSVEKWLALFVGTVTGGFARYSIAGAVYSAMGADFPYGTLIVNLSGCLLVGFFDGLAQVKFILGPNARVLLMTGFCGAYTTFSTLILETSHLAREGQISSAAMNLAISVVAGLALFRAGSILGALL